MRAASSRMKSGVTTNPAWPSTCDACASAAGVVFIAKYTPGSRVQAAIIAITPTNDSISMRSEEHTSELQSRLHLVFRLLLEKKKRVQRLPRAGTPRVILDEND